MDMTCVFLGLLITIGGLLFALGRVHPRLAAWQDMSQEERDKINIVPLVRNIGEVIMLCGLIFLAKGLMRDFSRSWFLGSMGAWMAVAAFDLWHISKSSRYQAAQQYKMIEGGNTDEKQ